MLQRVVILFGVFMVCCLKFNRAQNDGSTLYSRRYEKLDIDTILKSPRLVTNYVECLLSKKPCPPEGKALRRILPEALRTKCARCWPNQKEGALKVITKLYNNYPQHYNALRAKWDPTGEYHRRFMEYLRDQRFNAINSNGGDDEPSDLANIPQPVVAFTPSTILRPVPATTRSSVINLTTRPPQPPVTPVAIDQAQRPIDQDEIIQADNVASDFIANRFGENVDEFQDTTSKRSQTPRTPAPTPPREVIFSGTGYFQTQNPILNVINRLTMKFANTAEALASMLRGRVRI